MGRCFLIVILLVPTLFAQWEPDRRLTYNDSTSWLCENNGRAIAVVDSYIHVVWDDNRANGVWRIYYKRSTNNGITWDSDVDLSSNSDTFYFPLSVPSVAASGSIVYVVWADNRNGNYEIYFKRAINNGGIWLIDTRLTNDTSRSYYPSVAVSGNVVHVVWGDERGGRWQIYYKRSTDNGTNWGGDIQLTNSPAGTGARPAITVSDNNVHVVWVDYRDSGNWEIYYKRSTNSGTSWGEDIRLTNSEAIDCNPCIAVSGEIVHVAWTRSTEDEIYYKRSIDNGTTWGPDIRLTNAPSWSSFPSIAASGSNVHVAWVDLRGGITWELYYKRSIDNGTNWATDTQLTYHPAGGGGVWAPSVAITGSAVHVVWVDGRDYNYEIYYKRNPTGNIGIEEDESQNPKAESQKLTITPNPFRNTVSIKFQIPDQSAINSNLATCYSLLATLKIYDATGRLVRCLTLDAQRLTPVVWDGTDDLSCKLPAGVYFIRLESDGFKETEKVILLR